MNEIAIVAIIMVFGAPVVGVLAIVWMRTRLKHRDLELQRQRLQAEQQLRMDELNAKIIKMDDFGLSPGEIASLAEDVRRLREEVAQLRQELQNRTVGA
jgi:hypothetical protein